MEAYTLFSYLKTLNNAPIVNQFRYFSGKMLQKDTR
jgi:hypothetical protein